MNTFTYMKGSAIFTDIAITSGDFGTFFVLAKSPGFEIL